MFAQNGFPKCVGNDSEKWSSCRGSFSFPDGSNYFGEFKDGNFSGFGTFHYINGSVYIGEWLNGQRYGNGSLTYRNGNKYVGEWFNGSPNGIGIEYTSDGKVQTSGTYLSGKNTASYEIDRSRFPFNAEKPAGESNSEIAWLSFETDQAKKKLAEAEAQQKFLQQTAQAQVVIEMTQSLGLFVADLTENQKSALKIKGGVRVETLQEPAATAGLREGDIILSLGNLEVAQAKDFAAAVAKLDKTKSVSVLFKRNDITRFALIRPNQFGDAAKERNIADQKAKEEQRLVEEARNKEQQRLALEFTEISRLRAEFEESKRKQTELEEKLKLAQQQTLPSISFPAERRVALVIGNATYKFNPLKNPVNDSTDMAKSLRSVGFEVIEANNSTLVQMREATRRFADKLGSSDVGLVYYSGHGVEVKGKNYLIPVNADIKREYEVVDQAFDASQFLEMMDNIRGPNNKRVNILIVDACRNNELQKSWRSTNNGLARMDAPGGTFISFATAPGRVAADGVGRNSPYTKHLLQALKQPNVPIEQVFKVVRRNVMEETKGEQIPWENSSLVGDFYFTVVR